MLDNITKRQRERFGIAPLIRRLRKLQWGVPPPSPSHHLGVRLFLPVKTDLFIHLLDFLQHPVFKQKVPPTRLARARSPPWRAGVVHRQPGLRNLIAILGLMNHIHRSPDLRMNLQDMFEIWVVWISR